MSLPPRVCLPLFCLALGLIFPSAVFSQNPYAPQGGEYPPADSLPGDQGLPHLSINRFGGYIVWQDNYADEEGLGISARRLDGSLSGVMSNFRVNAQGAGDQENARVTLLKEGGAAFIWQGGRQGFQNIYVRHLSPENTWMTGDIQVNTYTNHTQLSPDIATLGNGTLVAVWSSWEQDGHMQGVFGKRLSPSGQKAGAEFQVNQFVEFSQRTPSVAALKDGGFVVAWVSEQQRVRNTSQAVGTVDIYARVYDSKGDPVGGEFLVNTSGQVCANPSVAASPEGGFVVAWGEKDTADRLNSWDIWSRQFNDDGTTSQPARRVNSFLYGDQIGPRISVSGGDYLVVWTSLGQDGSWEGVFGQFLNAQGAKAGGEFRVNTTTASRQKDPAAASDGAGRFLAAWTSFGGGVNSFDLQAQRYAPVADPLVAPAVPFVSVLGSTALTLSWPALAGFDVAYYQIFVDGADIAGATTSQTWHTVTNLAPSTTQTYRIAYVLADGRTSPRSASVTGTTYGRWTWGGIPFEWMEEHFGTDTAAWPSAESDGDGDGMTLHHEFLAGTNPTDAGSVLRTYMVHSDKGIFFTWTTTPGLVYQVQTSADLNGWTNLGAARFAHGSVDSLWVGGDPAAYYRVVRLR